MKQITAIIADDEKELRHHLKKLLNQLWPELMIAGESVNGLQTLLQVDKYNPDILFLDINMPGMTGIEVARKISSKCTIIFITAYDQYAIDAFENEALDYILKPVQIERLEACIKRCKKHLQRQNPIKPDLTAMLAELENKIIQNKKSSYLQWIRTQHGDSIRLIPVNDISVFKSSDKYTLVFTSSKTESLIRKPIKELEQELDPEKFWKIHRGTIVNVSSISKVSKSMTGKYVIKIEDHDEPLLVSRSYSHLFKQM
jgi:DNA-binding LytR/AlgR family response regulator